MKRVISHAVIEDLLSSSRSSVRRRQHINLHSSFQDPCQRLLNAVQPNSYIRPHRHSIDPRAETLFAIKGLFALITFDNEGEVISCTPFGSELFGASDRLACGVEVQPQQWHTVISLKDDSVLFEVKAGPFDPGAAKEFAPWAPEEDSPEAMSYLDWLGSLVKSYVDSEAQDSFRTE